MNNNTNSSENISEFLIHFLNQLIVEGTTNAFMPNVGTLFNNKE